MRQRGGAREIVDGDKVDVFVAERRAHDVAADAAESINPYSDGHQSLQTNVSFYNIPRQERFRHVSGLQPARAARPDCRVALLRVPGDSPPQVRREPRSAARLSSRVLQRRWRGVDLDPR